MKKADSGMSAKEIIDLGDDNKEIRDFLEKIRAAGEVCVRINGDMFLLTMVRQKTSQKGRDFLTRGGPIDD